MPRTKPIKGGKPPPLPARSGQFKATNRTSRVQLGVVSPVHLARMTFLPIAVLLAPILPFAISSMARDWMLGALGYGLIPVYLWMVGFILALRYRRAWIGLHWRGWVGAALLVAISLGIISMFDASSGVMEDASLGGYWGGYLGGSPVPFGALKVAFLVLVAPLLLYPRPAVALYRRWAWKFLSAIGLSLNWLLQRLAHSLRNLRARRPYPQQPTEPKTGVIIPDDEMSEHLEPAPVAQFPGSPRPVLSPIQVRQPNGAKKSQGWQLPSTDLLSRAENRQVSQAVLQQMSQHIEEILAQHRVEVAVEDIRTGPRVIRFGLVPGWIKKYRESSGTRSKSDGGPSLEMSRVKVQSILVREKDLALALKTPYLRLEAPVPGEALVGLEVPNPYPSTVALRSVAESAPFQKIASEGGMPVALGEDTGGEPVVSDLSKLPHLLIAGATGSGKSVCINSVVASLLLTNRPDRLRMLMVDPKRVELTPFNGIPHLVAPVIVDTDEVLVVLRGIQNEMIRRYKLMEGLGVRNIEGYNKKSGTEMPFLVIVIDELADLMMSAAYEVEHGLVRLAQLGRATGIHLILATQRPSVNVVTGLLKANIPARIAFAVASQVDSRVILDSVGAEKLLGKGDMLLLASDAPRPKRVQGTFVHDRDIEKLVEFWQTRSGPPVPDIPLDDDANIDSDDDDPEEEDLLELARGLAERTPHLSASVLQRRLQIGHLKAMHLMELLEEEGVISPTGELSGKPPAGRLPPRI